MKNEEITPPWIKYPRFPPYDGFWRQSGELWLVYVWEPFWNELTPIEKEDYLKRWDVPEYSYQINPEFGKWLESIDNN